jgi:hypothetical protein
MYNKLADKLSHTPTEMTPSMGFNPAAGEREKKYSLRFVSRYIYCC